MMVKRTEDREIYGCDDDKEKDEGGQGAKQV